MHPKQHQNPLPERVRLVSFPSFPQLPPSGDVKSRSFLRAGIESKRSHYLRYLPFGLIIVALLTGLLLVAIPGDAFHGAVEVVNNATLAVESSVVSSANETVANTEALGLILYTEYVLAFELAAVILLVSIIAAITLVHRRAKRSKHQNIVSQIMTRRDQRVRLVKMKSE